MLLPPQSSVFACMLALGLGACGDPATDADGATPTTSASAVRPGITVLLADSLHLVRGRRVGLITNHTGVFENADGELVSVIDALHAADGVRLTALFGPEHGLRGEAEAGEHVDSGVDAGTGVPIHSLYGDVRRPTPESLEDLDVLVFDMQDVGARYYTYVSTMAYGMEAAGAAGLPFVVLDRPNPIRGDVVQGNVLEPDFSTFVGLYPVPMRHGMTAGELARMYVGSFGIDVELHVVPAEGWRRDVPFSETALPWIPPSPNMPSLESALAYPGTCLFEGTLLSVGRGTDRAFQWIGAPWLDGAALADAMSGYGFEGVRFQPVSFTPQAPGDGKFDGEEVHGVRMIPESTTWDAPRVAVALLLETRRASGDRWGWRPSHFDRLAGTDALRAGIEAGETLEDLTAGWPTEQRRFQELRAPYLIYPTTAADTP